MGRRFFRFGLFGNKSGGQTIQAKCDKPAAKDYEAFTFSRAVRWNEEAGLALVLCFPQSPTNTERTNRPGLYRR
jgi:hypothetical protein